MRITNCYPYTFGTPMEPAPAVQAYCFFSRLNSGYWVTFMVDTGAAGTCLHGMPAWSVQPHMRKETLEYASGVGGTSKYYGEKATLVFTDSKTQPIAKTLQRLDIHQITPKDIMANHGIPDTPSLLGRDILNKWRFEYDYPKGMMNLIVP